MFRDSRASREFTVFLDRDGTLNHETGYITSPDDLVLFDGVVEALVRLKQAGGRLVLVTNQSAIGRGWMTVADLASIHRRLDVALMTAGVRLDGMFVCPHRPDEGCRCRKPRPGLVEDAVAQLGIDVRRSYVVGDKSIDMELAQNVGAVGVLVTTSPFSRDALQAVEAGRLRVEKVAESLTDAAEWIIDEARKRARTSSRHGVPGTA